MRYFSEALEIKKSLLKLLTNFTIFSPSPDGLVHGPRNLIIILINNMTNPFTVTKFMSLWHGLQFQITFIYID